MSEIYFPITGILRVTILCKIIIIIAVKIVNPIPVPIPLIIPDKKISK